MRSFGRFLALNAATDEFLLGRWEAAEARLAELGDADLEPWNAITRNQIAGQLHLARGRLEEAARELREAEALCEGAPAEYVPVVYAGLAEVELWHVRTGAARELVEQGLKAMRGVSELLYAPSLFAIGVRVEAEAALGAASPLERERAVESGRPVARGARRSSCPGRRRRRRRSPTATPRAPRPRGPPARTARTRGARWPTRGCGRRSLSGGLRELAPCRGGAA